MLPPPPPLESEQLPSSLSTPPASIAPAPAPAAAGSTPTDPQSQWTSAPKASSGSSNGQNYVVQKGDTLYSISRRFYGSGNNWKTIAELNGITDPSKLRVGQELTLP